MVTLSLGLQISVRIYWCKYQFRPQTNLFNLRSGHPLFGVERGQGGEAKPVDGQVNLKHLSLTWEPIFSWIFIVCSSHICNHDHDHLLVLIKYHQTLLLHVELSGIQQGGERNKAHLYSNGCSLL